LGARATDNTHARHRNQSHERQPQSSRLAFMLFGMTTVGRSLPVTALLLEAGRAVHRLITPRLEGHPSDATTLGTLHLEHLAGRTVVAATAIVVAAPATAAPALVGSATLRTASRLVGEAL